ncbi:MAG: class I SAM-dependent methyltransferase [Bacillota bacterium]
MPALIVTTSLRTSAEVRDLARRLAGELGCPFVERNKLGLDALAALYGADGIVHVGEKRVSLLIGGQEFFYHPGMAKLRIKEIIAGKTDQMVKALGLLPGDTVLDCTLGLGADAVVASYIVGVQGRVVALESTPVLAVLMRHGLQTYNGNESGELVRAMRRVEVVCARHEDFLRDSGDGTFDVVYFDPMFRKPINASSAMEPLRLVANNEPVKAATVDEAIRVARKRVVLKERRGSDEFSRLGFTRVEGGRYSPIAYGIIEKGAR